MQQLPLLENPMLVWQSALIALGCQLDVGSQLLPLELRPVEDRLVCTAPCSGAMLPFDVLIEVGQTLTITWDSELSRYLLKVAA